MTPLQAIGWRWTPPTLDPDWAAIVAAHPQARPARIVEQHRSGYLVSESVDAAHRAESLPEWQRAGSYRKGELSPEQRPAVGDWVLVEGEAPNSLRIVALLPRFSAIKRGAAGEHYRQQVIAANIDSVFVVSGLDADFNPRRIERYLLLVAGSGVQPVVVLTKSDKDGADVDAALHDLRALDVPVVHVNAKDRASVNALAPWLGAGCSIVLVGSSGAGKSTLTNTLLGIEKMKTGAVRAGDDRGGRGRFGGDGREAGGAGLVCQPDTLGMQLRGDAPRLARRRLATQPAADRREGEGVEDEQQDEQEAQGRHALVSQGGRGRRGAPPALPAERDRQLAQPTLGRWASEVATASAG